MTLDKVQLLNDTGVVAGSYVNPNLTITSDGRITSITSDPTPGPTGPTGPTGAPGPTGSTGAPGTPGPSYLVAHANIDMSPLTILGSYNIAYLVAVNFGKFQAWFTTSPASVNATVVTGQAGGAVSTIMYDLLYNTPTQVYLDLEAFRDPSGGGEWVPTELYHLCFAVFET